MVGIGKIRNFIILSQAGVTLSELVVSIGVSALVMMVMASVFSLGLTHFNLLLEQHQAEQALMESAYFLRSFMSQAVRTTCCRGNNPNTCVGGAGYTKIPIPPPNFNLTVAANDMPNGQSSKPATIPLGFLDCRNAAPITWTLNKQNPLGIFMRENGGTGGGTTPASDYVSTGVYFQPPTAPVGTVNGASGIIFFANGVPTGPTTFQITANTTSIYFDHIVDVQPVANTVVESQLQRMASISYKLTARYYLSMDAVRDYRVSTLTGPFKNIDMVVNVGLRDNWLGTSPLSATTAERLNGQIYYYKIMAPSFGALNN